MGNLTRELSNNTKLTLVGIDIRRGDKVGNKRYYLATQQYFIKAMQYFKSKYQAVHFVVAGDDRKWARRNISPLGNTSLLPTGSSPAVDMAALTLCDHVIISVGSFGFWAGWLGKGEVVYCTKPEHPFDGGKNYPGNWIGMTNDG